MNKNELIERIKQQNEESKIIIELSDGTRHEIERVSKDGNAIVIHVEGSENIITYIPSTVTNLNIVCPTPNVCEGCSVHPNNGGSGICNCTLGQNITYCTDL